MPISMEIKKISSTLDSACAKGKTFLTAPDLQELSRFAGLPIPPSAFAKDEKDVLEKSKQLKYPLVMKISSPQVLHKSDCGGIQVGIQNENDLKSAYSAILKNVQKNMPSAEIEGVEICEMEKPSLELIVGARKDPQFGPMLMFGLGGVYVEVFKEVAFRSLPISIYQMDEMIQESRIYPLLCGVRGEKAKDLPSLKEIMFRISYLIQNFPSIQDIEINPFRVYEKGVKALDLRVMLKR
jgi:acyl-CoA synthetase (NDP forming)